MKFRLLYSPKYITFLLVFIFLLIFIIVYFLGTRYITQLQKEHIYTIEDISDEYYGKMNVEDPTKVFSKGWIAIYDKKSNKEILKVTSDELTFVLHDGKLKSNILELPYGEQSNIIYKDFNFDGINDLAIMDGQKSCYRGPSFQVYLAINGTFIYNEDFTILAQQYCGMFNVDYEKKEISTMKKSGCCWHEYSNFKVVNNVPQLVNKTTDEATSKDNVRVITEEKLINNEWVKKVKELPL